MPFRVQSRGATGLAISDGLALSSPPAPGGSRLSEPGKLLQLEGLRGLAAAIVVIWHFLWAFAPWELGSVAGLNSSGLVGSPVLASIDGPAAVALFFVLSGFVIPLRLLRSGQTRVVLQAAARRWPRLAGLSVLAVLFSYVLFRFGLFHYREAANLTGSDWLASYGGGDPHGALAPALTPALREGLIGAFLDKADSYNPVLWTMRHELFGSFLSMGLALAMNRLSRRGSGAVLVVAGALAAVTDPWLVPFVAGTGLAFSIRSQGTQLGWLTATASIGAGLYLFGYLEPVGAYSGIPVLQDAAGYRYDRILTHTAGGVLIILALVGSDGVGRALSTKPLVLLGKLSFPIYLFHFPLLCSLGCGLFLALRQNASYGTSVLLAAVVYVVVVVLIAAVLAPVDDLWGHWVNRGTTFVLRFGARVLPACGRAAARGRG